MGFVHTRRLKKIIFIFSQNVLFQKYHTTVQNYLTKVEAEYFHSALTVANKSPTIRVCFFFSMNSTKLKVYFMYSQKVVSAEKIHIFLPTWAENLKIFKTPKGPS